MSSITQPQHLRIRPEYTQETIKLEFATNDEYEVWFNTVASKHAVFRYKDTHKPTTLKQGYPIASVYFKCDHAGQPEKRKNVTPEIKKRKTMKPSIKVGCKAKLTKHVFADRKVSVVYNWIHNNHNPWNVEDFANSRLPLELRNWIVDCVDRHMNIKSIKSLLRLNLDELDDLDVNIVGGRFPPSLIIKQQDVVNIVNQKLNSMSRKHPIDRRSVHVWLEYLKSKNHCTFLFEQDSGPFVVGWYSQWQKGLLESSLDWCIDSTHHTCKSMTNPDQYCYLYTIVIRSPFTNKGVPVAFMLTSNEIIPNWVKWFRHLKEKNNLNVQRIMIDCSTTEIGAIRQVFDGVDILLCHWHIKRAWEAHIKAIKGNDKFETKATRDAIRHHINTMMQASSTEASDESWALFKTKYQDDCSTFYSYFESLWYNRKELWVKAFRQDAPFHTNNLIESYHGQLKTLYLGRKRQNRMDRTIYILSQVMISDYRLEAVQVYYRIKQFHLTKDEKKARNRAEEIEDDTAYAMIIKINEELYTCRSFTNEQVVYNVVVASAGFVVSCSCSCCVWYMQTHVSCKVIPYYNHHAISASTSSSVSAIPVSSSVSTSSTVSPFPASSSESINNANVVEFNNKISILENHFIRSVNHAKKRVLGDDIFMDEICDRIKTSMEIVDNIVNRSMYSSRQL